MNDTFGKIIRMIGAISAGHEQTKETAKHILKMGGNAFDAAIAAHLAMYITEPCMASAGAGGFALCYTPSNGVEMLDFFAHTPQTKNINRNIDFFPIEVNFGNEVEEFHLGAASMATPGSVAAIFELHKKYASLPLDVLIDPVIDLARNGVAIDRFQSIDMGLLEPILYNDKSVRDIFFKDDKLKGEGDIVFMPCFEDFLDFIKKEGVEGFYKGEIGQEVARYSEEKGGFLTRSDFESYKVVWKKPLTVNYNNHKLVVPNTPSIGGATLLIYLASQREFPADNLMAVSNTLDLCSPLSRISTVAKNCYPHLPIDVSDGSASTKGTSHFNIVDKWGNAISFTCSLGEGAGYFIPGTDMQMNNMLGESFLLPGGFHSWDTNIRLNSMMTPTMVLDRNDELRFVTGSGGAGRIPYMIKQVLDRYFIEEMSLSQATQAARIYSHHNTFHFEEGYSIKEEWLHKPYKEWTEKSLFFGGVHSIAIEKEGRVFACGDDRRYGIGEVF